jgi:hypothetical protein
MSTAKSSYASDKQLGIDIDEANTSSHMIKSDEDFDPNAPPVPSPFTHTGPLSRIPVTTIAKHMGRRTSSTYINMHSHGQCRWYTYSTARHETSLENLIDVANPISRRISQVKDPRAERLRPEAFSKITDVVFRYDGSTMFPLEAVELLNPRIIKQTDRYSNTRKRKDYTKDHNGRCLPKYPCSLVQVKWRDTGESSWETASDLKRLLSKNLFEVERKIYAVALGQALGIELLIRGNRAIAPYLEMLKARGSPGIQIRKPLLDELEEKNGRSFPNGWITRSPMKQLGGYAEQPSLVMYSTASVSKGAARQYLIAPQHIEDAERSIVPKNPITIMDLPSDIVEIICSYVHTPPYSGNIIPSPVTLRVWRSACRRLPSEIMDLVCEQILTPPCLDNMIPSYVALRSSYAALCPWRTTCQRFWDLLSCRIWESVVIPACPDVSIRLEQLYQRWDKIRPLGPPNFLDKLQYLEWEIPERGNTAGLPHMPILKDLRIRFPKETWIHRAQLLNFQLQPQLRALRLYGRTSDPEAMAIVHGRLFLNNSESLQYLWISCLRFGIGMGHFLSRNSHALTRLELVSCVYPPMHNSDNSSAELPTLQHLGIIVNYDREYCTFDKLVYPRSAMVSVEMQGR